jgi:predicted alpha/beta-fold hydrolase
VAEKKTIPEFEPHSLLRNGHAMTIAAVYWRRSFALPQPQRRLFRVAEDSQLLAACHWQEGRGKDVPLVAIVHGLEGSCDSNYVLGIAEKAYQCGFHVVRLNQRNCGDSEKLTPTLYNSGMSADYRAVLEELADGDGFTQIFFSGYSMGGNLVTKMAGEYGNAAPRALRGVCAICPALDLASCADALNKRENYFYQRHFVNGLMARYARKAALFPKIYSRNGFGKIRTVREFDDAITAPCFGYRDAQEYYEAASARKVVGQIRVPMLMITAQDDPFVPYKSFLAALVSENPSICFVAPQHGGHCAFISKHSGRDRFWAEAGVVDFCHSLRN